MLLVLSSCRVHCISSEYMWQKRVTSLLATKWKRKNLDFIFSSEGLHSNEWKPINNLYVLMALVPPYHPREEVFEACLTHNLQPMIHMHSRTAMNVVKHFWRLQYHVSNKAGYSYYLKGLRRFGFQVAVAWWVNTHENLKLTDANDEKVRCSRITLIPDHTSKNSFS